MAELEKCNATTHIELNKAYVDEDDEDDTKRFQEMGLIMSTNLDLYSRIWNYLNNSTLLGTDNYPKTTTSAYDVLCRYKKPAPPRQVHTLPAAVTCVQSGDTEKNKTTPGKYGKCFLKVTCYHCQEAAHYQEVPGNGSNHVH